MEQAKGNMQITNKWFHKQSQTVQVWKHPQKSYCGEKPLSVSNWFGETPERNVTLIDENQAAEMGNGYSPPGGSAQSLSEEGP